MSEQSKCRIWGTHAVVEPRTGAFEIVSSPRAGGKYWITDRATAILERRDDQLKTRLTSWLIAQHRLGVELPRINSVTIRDAGQRKRLSVQQRANSLLRIIQKNTPKIGSDLEIFGRKPWQTGMEMQALAWSESTEKSELMYLLNHLISIGFLEEVGIGYRITVSGYSRLASLERSILNSSKAFVAMWFDDSMTDLWENGIHAAIVDTGYQAMRVDQKEHVNKIDDEIIAEIRRSRFIVADFTHGSDGSRGGVYYEAGFAHGLGLPVIFTCRQDVLDQVHFDTRQYNHIVWKTPEELRDKLSKRIAAVIGDGPFKADDSQ